MSDRSRVREAPTFKERCGEAARLWHENGLTLEFLEGMTYNHRVAVMGAARLVADPSTIILTGEKCEDCGGSRAVASLCLPTVREWLEAIEQAQCPSCRGSGTTWKRLREKMIPSMAEAIAGDRAEEITDEHAADAAAAFDAVLAVLTEEGTE